MNPLISQYIWQICDAHLPELQYKLRNGSSQKFAHQLPDKYLRQVQASGFEKAYNNYFTEVYSTDKRVLALPVQGEMSRGGYWNYGNEFYIRQLNAAAKDPDYAGAVIPINSPGGTADSTPEFAQAVANFRKVKPINAVTAYAGSAAYCVISQCNKIFVINQAASSLGSIGTLIIVENYAEHLKMNGIETKIIRATASTNKALVNPYEPWPQEALDRLQANADACQVEFAGTVKRGRGGIITSSEVYTGLMYGLNDSLKFGLADEKGNLKAAVDNVLQAAA